MGLRLKVAMLVAVSAGALVNPPTADAVEVVGSPLAWGMDVRSVAPLKAAGAEPDYATFWVGAWSDRGWGGVRNALASARDAGVTPVVHWYYWGDDISPRCVEKGCWSSLHHRYKTRATWFSLANQLASAVRDTMGGRETVIILETEFNKHGVDHASYAPRFDRLLREHVLLFERVPGVRTVVGFGAWNEARWSHFPLSVAAADWTGTQALRSSVRATPERYLGVVDAIAAATTRMRETYPTKPVLLTDVALSSYPNAAWAERQRKVVEEFFARDEELLVRGLVGVLYRSLYDNPSMDTRNYHREAERHWGLVRADGSAKPAYHAWMRGVGAVMLSTDLVLAPGRVEAEDMRATAGGRVADSRASGDAAWNLWSNGRLVQHVAAPLDGEWTVTVRARGSPASGVWPRMTLSAGDLGAVASWTVASRGYRDFTATVDFDAAEATELRVLFTNDLGPRNLVVDRVTVTRAGAPPLPLPGPP